MNAEFRSGQPSGEFDPDQERLVSGLFAAALLRFEDAVREQNEVSGYSHILTDRDPVSGELNAIFGLTESFDLFRHNQGEKFEVIIPVDESAISTFHPRPLLGKDNPSRHFKIRHMAANGAVRMLKVSNYKIDEYYENDVSPEGEAEGTPRARLEDLLVKLLSYELVPIRKRGNFLPRKQA